MIQNSKSTSTSNKLQYLFNRYYFGPVAKGTPPLGPTAAVDLAKRFGGDKDTQKDLEAMANQGMDQEVREALGDLYEKKQEKKKSAKEQAQQDAERKAEAASNKEMQAKAIGFLSSAGAGTSLEDYYNANVVGDPNIIAVHKNVEEFKRKVLEIKKAQIAAQYIGVSGSASLAIREADMQTALNTLRKRKVITAEEMDEIINEVRQQKATVIERIAGDLEAGTITEVEANARAARYSPDVADAVKKRAEERAKNSPKVNEKAPGILDRMRAAGPGQLSKTAADSEVDNMVTAGEISPAEGAELKRRIKEEEGKIKMVEGTEAYKNLSAGDVLGSLADDIDSSGLPPEIKRAFKERIRLIKESSANQDNIDRLRIEKANLKRLGIEWKRIKIIGRYLGAFVFFGGIGALAGGALAGGGLGALGSGLGGVFGAQGAVIGGTALAGIGGLGGVAIGGLAGAGIGIGREYLTRSGLDWKQLQTDAAQINQEVTNINDEAQQRIIGKAESYPKILANILAARYGVDADEMLDIIQKRFGINSKMGDINSQLGRLKGVVFASPQQAAATP